MVLNGGLIMACTFGLLIMGALIYYWYLKSKSAESFSGGGGGSMIQLQARDSQDLYEMGDMDWYDIYPYVSRYPYPLYYNPYYYNPYILGTALKSSNPYYVSGYNE